MENNELKCPLCGEDLLPRKYSGVMIYSCEQHGTWLFKGLLKELLWNFSRTDRVRTEAVTAENKKLRNRSGFPGLTGFLSLTDD